MYGITVDFSPIYYIVDPMLLPLENPINPIKSFGPYSPCSHLNVSTFSPPWLGGCSQVLDEFSFFKNPSVSTPPILSVSRLYSLFSILCTLYSVLCTNSGSGKRAEYKERRHPLQYGPADKNVPIKKFRRESWTHSPAHGSDQVSCAGDVRASGNRRAVVEVWGTVATWFGLVRGGVITRRAQSAGACP